MPGEDHPDGEASWLPQPETVEDTAAECMVHDRVNERRGAMILLAEAVGGTGNELSLVRTGDILVTDPQALGFMNQETHNNRFLRRWLIAIAISVCATLVIGGATRLTESGLSITEWKPVTGVVPPMSEEGWDRAYQQYLLIPEAQTVHAGITVAQFKSLYWWEWAHRLAGRVVGLVVAIPFLVLWLRGRIPRHLFGRFLSLPLLVGAQGVLGWYMVSSGLSDRTSVSQYRLVAHLSLALVIYAIAVWTVAAIGRSAAPRAPDPVRRNVGALLIAVAMVIMTGGFVAGLDAGRIFNEFPLMGGRFVPEGYGSGLRNLFENPIAAQFNHRILAMLVAVATWVTWIISERGWPAGVRRWMRFAALAAALQLTLGIATLLSGAAVGIAMLHQLGAVLLLTTLLVAAVEARGNPRPAGRA